MQVPQIRTMFLACTYIFCLFNILFTYGQDIFCNSEVRCDCETLEIISTYYCSSCSIESETSIYHDITTNELTIFCNKEGDHEVDVRPKGNLEFVTSFEMHRCRNEIFYSTLHDYSIARKINANPMNNTKRNDDLDEWNKIDIRYDICLNMPNLDHLVLESIRLDYIPKHTFQNSSKLKYIALIDTNLKHLQEGIFDDLINLEVLLLSSNELTEISRKIFKSCEALEILQIEMNPNLVLVDEVFANFTSLKSAYLCCNKLKILPESLFRGSSNLKTIYLDHNELEDLPKHIFKDLQKIQKLFLNNNKLSYIHPDIFAESTELELVNLSRNKLKVLPETLFDGLENLQRIYLYCNTLQNISQNFFFKIPNLRELYLNNNKLSYLHPQIFWNLGNLHILNLSYNHLNKFNIPVLKSVENLVFESKYDTIPGLPKWVSVARHIEDDRFSFINHKPNFNRMISLPFEKLKYVDLSYNDITVYPAMLNLISTIEEINLEHNAIREIQLPDMLTFNSIITKVNLAFNNISSINFTNSYWYEEFFVNKYRTQLNLMNNPILCDCHALDLAKSLKQDNYHLKLILFDSSLKCSAPAINKGRLLNNIPLEELTCSLETNCTNNAACDCRYRSLDRTLIVDCAYKNLTTVPSLTINKIPEYYPINYNQTEVHLEGNQLDASPNEYDGYSNVTRLYLQHNKIEGITWLPKSIEVLDLRRNAMQNLDETSLHLLENSSLKKLYLGNNAWKCNCATRLFLYLREHSTKVDIEDIRCNRTGKQVINLNGEDYCASSHWNVKIILVIIVLSCLLIVASSIAFYHYYKKEILIWLFSRGLLCCGGENIVDKDKVYDAFISFSHKDEDFIVDHLIPTLEGGEHKYKLCIHTRDFIPGELISTQIFNTVKKSRRTIVVLSSNFLDSIWGRMEFRTAHTEAMKEGRARVIILVYGDVNLNSLDDELKAYIKTNTYLKWGEPLFWTKLKYALHIKNRRIIGNSRSHSKRVQSINSQFDLKNKPKCSSVSKTTPYALESGDLEEDKLIQIA